MIWSGVAVPHSSRRDNWKVASHRVAGSDIINSLSRKGHWKTKRKTIFRMNSHAAKSMAWDALKTMGVTSAVPSGTRMILLTYQPLRGWLVRLRRPEDGAVRVRFCAVKNRAVSNRNCVAARRGGEQRGENDQSVTQVVRWDHRGELDSVGVGGRVFERLTKPAKRTLGGEPKRRAAGRTPDVAPMVGDGMAGSPSAIIRETRRGQAAFKAPWPEEPPGGSQSVHSSNEAGNDRGAKGRRKVDA